MTWNSAIHKKDAVPLEGSQTALIQEAVEVLREAADENALFLWTGGKEAQVIADLLLYSVHGDNETSPVPFGVIDTGNHFEEMYGFREEYLEVSGDQGADTVGPFTGIGNEVIVERHDDFLEHIIDNEYDPRGYHGEHSGEWKCPSCGEVAERDNKVVVCSGCGEETTLHPVQRQNLSQDGWGVPESCGALKVVPIKRFIGDHGFDTLITGQRETDVLVNTEEQGELGLREERDEPVEHTRVNPLANWKEANVYAYIKQESVSLPTLYTEKGYRHTDAECCTEKDDGVSEYGEGGVDPEKIQARDRLQDMGYI